MIPKLVCTQCGYVGNPKSAVKGSGGVEILLWIFFLIPGLIYSAWRSSSRHPVCPKCKTPNLIPIDSPRGQKIMGESMSQEDISKTIDSEKEKILAGRRRRMRFVIFVIISFVILFVAASII